jgi:hypothetical protein
MSLSPHDGESCNHSRRLAKQVVQIYVTTRFRLLRKPLKLSA